MIWDMQNPTLVGQYEQHSSGLLELDSWVAVNDLGDAMADMHSYGFTSLDANQSGMKFTTGNVPMGGSSRIKKGSKQMVLCKIAVGKAFVIHREEDAKQKLPTGYNSFYLLRDGLGENGDVQATSGYYHEYVLNNTLQILPQYLVRFAFSKIDFKAAGPCALCEKHSAAVVCRACEAEICASCDQEVHSANKLVSRHKRTPLKLKVQPESDAEGSTIARARRRSSTPSTAILSSITVEAPNNDASEDDVNAVVMTQLQQGLAELSASCRFHEGKSVEFYCPVCELPVCVNCKMLGDHSVGERGSHRLLSISDAYELSLRESLMPDPLIESRKSVIDSKLKTISRWKQELQANRDAVEAAIRDQCQQALQQLDHETSAKMQVLNGDAMEFQRQLHQIEWAEDNLDDQRASSHAVAFLATWNQHKMLRAEQRDFPVVTHGPSADHVKADLHLIGRLRVITGDPAAFSETDTCDAGSATAAIECDSPIRRRPSDSDIRKKLLSMKAVVNPYQAEGSPGRTASRTGTFMSPRCAQFMEDIKNDLLTKGTVTMNSRTAAFTMAAPSSQSGTPGLASIRGDATASLRGFSIFSSRRQSLPLHGPPSASKQRTFRGGSDAWSTMLRQELNQQQQPTSSEM